MKEVRNKWIAKAILIGFVLLFYSQLGCSETIFVYDDFNDNSLNTTLWKQVVEDSSSFAETNQEAQFTVNTQRSELIAFPFNITGWTYINISGEWKFTNPNTAEMRCKLVDSLNENFAGVYYATWTTYAHEHIRYYGTTSGTINEDRAIPRNYVNFSIVFNKTVMQYWENGVLIKEVNSTILQNTTEFYLEIGGYDASSGNQYIYFNWIKLSSDGTPSAGGNASQLTLTITNPPEDYITQNNYVNITVVSNNNLTNATLEWNGTNETMNGEGKNWHKFKSELVDGVYHYKVYGEDIYNNTNETEMRTMTVDTTPPVYSNVSQSKDIVYLGENLTASAFWEDLTLEAAWIMANFTIEGTNPWVKYSEMEMDPPSGWSNFTLAPSMEDVGKTICWKIYANDTSGLENVTEEHCFLVKIKVNITSASPEEQNIYNDEGDARLFNITINQHANVSWYINGSLVYNETDVNLSEYNNNSALEGNWNVTVVVSNENGSDSHSWNWTVYPPLSVEFVSPTPSNGQHFSYSTTSITIKASANKEINNCTLEWNGVNESSEPSGNNCTFTKAVSSGNTYTFRIYVLSDEENANTEERTITVDQQVKKNKKKKKCFEGNKAFIVYFYGLSGLKGNPDYKTNEMRFIIKYGDYKFDESYYTICYSKAEYDYKNKDDAKKAIESGKFSCSDETRKDLSPYSGKRLMVREILEKNRITRIKVVAKDRCGETYEEEVYATYCVFDDPPSISIEFPKEGELYTFEDSNSKKSKELSELGIEFKEEPQEIPIKYNVNKDVVKVKYYLNGEPYKEETIHKESLKQGKNTFTVEVEDECGHKVSKTSVFQVNLQTIQGDWIIDDTQECKNEMKTVNGNVIIKNTGTLVLNNCFLYFNSSMPLLINNGTLNSTRSTIDSRDKNLMIFSNKENSRFVSGKSTIRAFSIKLSGFSEFLGNTLEISSENGVNMRNGQLIFEGNTMKKDGGLVIFDNTTAKITGNTIEVSSIGIDIIPGTGNINLDIERNNIKTEDMGIYYEPAQSPISPGSHVYINANKIDSAVEASVVLGGKNEQRRSYLKGITLSNNTFSDIVYMNAEQGLIQSNTFLGEKGLNLLSKYMDDVKIIRNNFTNSEYCLRVGAYVSMGKSGDLYIENNDFRNAKNAISYFDTIPQTCDDIQQFFKLHLKNNNFYSTNAAIVLFDYSGNVNWYIDNSEIINSNVSVGCSGKIHLSHSHLTLINSTLRDMDYSPNWHYGTLFEPTLSIIIMNNSEVNMHASTFSWCKVIMDNTKFSEPLKFFASVVSLNGMDIENKTVGIEFDGNTIGNITNSIIKGNTKGIYQDSCAIRLNNVTFINNDIGYEIYYDYNNESYIIENSKFLNSNTGIKLVQAENHIENKSRLLATNVHFNKGFNTYRYSHRDYWFDIDKAFSNATLYLKYDHEISLMVNGVTIYRDFLKGGRWIKSKNFDITRYLKKGSNVIRVTSRVWYDNYATLYKMELNTTEFNSYITNTQFISTKDSIYSNYSDLFVSKSLFDSKNIPYSYPISARMGKVWIKGNVFNNSLWSMSLYDLDYAEIRGNKIYPDGGISLARDKKLRVLENEFYHSGTGVSFSNTNYSHIEIIRNKFYNPTHGIDISDSYTNGKVIVKDNYFKGGFQCIRTYKVKSSNAIEENTLDGCYEGVYNIIDSKASIVKNRFIGNEMAIVFDPNNANLNLSSNTFFDNKYDVYVNNGLGDESLDLFNSHAGGKTLISNDDKIFDYVIYQANDDKERGSNLLKAVILNVSSTRFGDYNSNVPIVGGIMTVKTFAASSDYSNSFFLRIINDENETVKPGPGGFTSPGEHTYIMDIHDVDDGVYTIYYEVINNKGEKTYAKRKIRIANSEFEIQNVRTSKAEDIYVYLSNPDKFAYVNVTIKNNGSVGGLAHLTIELPDYLKEINNKLETTVWLDAGEVRTLSIPVKLTRFDFRYGWKPSNYSVFPSDKKIPITINLKSYPTFIDMDSKSAAINFTLGPIIEIIEFQPESWINYGTGQYPYDGDGDGLLESGEEYHYNLSFRNVGDKPINITRVVVDEIIHTKTQNYWTQATKDMGYIINYYDYDKYMNYGDKECLFHGLWREVCTDVQGNTWERMITDLIPGTGSSNSQQECYYEEISGKCNPARMFKTLIPASQVQQSSDSGSFVYSTNPEDASTTGLLEGYMDPWPSDLSHGKHSPMNYSGPVDIFLLIEGTSEGKSVISVSVNRKQIYVEAFEKNYYPNRYSFKKGYVRVIANSIDLDKKLVNFDIINHNENVYFVYKLDGAWDNNAKGYAWSNIIPPTYHFKATAYNAKDPNKDWPSFKVHAGVKWSESMNILALVLKGAEQIVNAILDEASGGTLGELGIQVEFSDKVMALINAGMALYNAWDTVGKQNPVMNEFTILGVTFTHEDFERMANKGMDQEFFEELKSDGFNAERANTFIYVMMTEPKVLKLFSNSLIQIVTMGVVDPASWENTINSLDPTDPSSGDAAMQAASDEFTGDIQDEVLDTLEDEGKITESQKAGIGAAIEAATYSFTWVLQNAEVAGTEEMDIIIDDPPGKYVSKVNIIKSNYFGGLIDESGNSGNAKIKMNVKRNGLVEFVGDYYILKDETNVDYFKDMKRVEFHSEGKREGKDMKGKLELIMEPEGDALLGTLLFIRNPKLSEMLLSQYFEKLDDKEIEIINNSIIKITGEGVFYAPEDDIEFKADLLISEVDITGHIERKGYYVHEEKGKKKLNMKFGPRLGIPLNNTEINITSEETLVIETDEGEIETKNYYSESTPSHVKATISPKVASKETTTKTKQEKIKEEGKDDFNNYLIIGGVIIIGVLIYSGIKWIKMNRRNRKI